MDWELSETSPHAGLTRLTDLATCPDDPAFGVWAAGALAPYGKVIVPPFSPADWTDVALRTPVLRIDVPEGGCLAAASGSAAEGWFVRDAQGRILARAVSAPHDRNVPSQIVASAAATNTYIQDLIGSGQPFSGGVVAGSVAGVINERLLVLEYPGWRVPGEGETLAYNVRQALNLARLDFPWERRFLPEQLPQGYDICSVAPKIPGQAGGTAYRVVEFCTSDGGSLLLGFLEPGDVTPPADGEVGVGKGRGRSYARGTRNGVWFAPEPTSVRYLWVDGPDSVGLQRLADVLASMPVLRSGARPADGHDTPAYGEEHDGHIGLGDGLPEGPVPPGPTEYVVREGDSLWSIAERMYGDGRYWPLVRDANDIGSSQPLRVGVRLAIPRALTNSIGGN